jgi:hypothetical protein
MHFGPDPSAQFTDLFAAVLSMSQILLSVSIVFFVTFPSVIYAEFLILQTFYDQAVRLLKIAC